MTSAPRAHKQLTVGLVVAMLAVLVPLLATDPATAQSGGPAVRSMSVIDGAILSPNATPRLFPNGPTTLFLRGRVDADARVVQVRIEDFWSANEWQPSTDCREARVGRTCAEGAMAPGMRFSRADVSSVVQNGSRSFTYRTQLPDGMYRIRLLARTSGADAPGQVLSRWFRIFRPASAAAAEARIISRTPSNTAQRQLTDRFMRTPIRLIGNTAATRVHWALREDATGRFYHATPDTVRTCPQRWDCRFQDGAFVNRREFTGWQSTAGGRVFYNWSLPLLPGRYTMWTTGVNSSGKRGPTVAHAFTVVSPGLANPTLELDGGGVDGTLEAGRVRFSGTSGDSGSREASPVVSLSIYDLDAGGFVRPDGSIGTFRPFSAIAGTADDWGAEVEFSEGNYRVTALSTWPDGRTLQSEPTTVQVGPCPVGGCPRARLGRIEVSTSNRNFDLSIVTDALDQGGSGRWTLLRVGDSRWYDAEAGNFKRRWTLNDLARTGDRRVGPAVGTPRRLAVGNYFLGLRLFNGADEEGDIRWISFRVR